MSHPVRSQLKLPPAPSPGAAGSLLSKRVLVTAVCYLQEDSKPKSRSYL